MDDEFLTVAEIATTLRLNQQTVRNMIDRGDLAAVRVGQRRVRVRRSALDEFVAAGETQAAGPDDRETTAEQDMNTDDWARLGSALAGSSAALADGDRAELTRALISLADAARALADALGAGHAS